MTQFVLRVHPLAHNDLDIALDYYADIDIGQMLNQSDLPSRCFNAWGVVFIEAVQASKCPNGGSAMSMTERMIIDLPVEQAQLVRAKVARGEYANESEAVSAGLVSGFEQFDDEQNEELEHWLRTEVVAEYEGLRANPESGRTVEQVRSRLARERATW